MQVLFPVTSGKKKTALLRVFNRFQQDLVVMPRVGRDFEFEDLPSRTLTATMRLCVKMAADF